MSREIKFRFWNKDEKKFIYPKDSRIMGTFISMASFKAFDCEIEQFTGLKDKNGKEIYEGDICRAFKANSYLDGKYIVEWCDKKGRWKYKGNSYQIGSSGNLKCEVIGNIHENPNLIK